MSVGPKQDIRYAFCSAPKATVSKVPINTGLKPAGPAPKIAVKSTVGNGPNGRRVAAAKLKTHTDSKKSQALSKTTNGPAAAASGNSKINTETAGVESPATVTGSSAAGTTAQNATAQAAPKPADKTAAQTQTTAAVKTGAADEAVPAICLEGAAEYYTSRPNGHGGFDQAKIKCPKITAKNSGKLDTRYVYAQSYVDEYCKTPEHQGEAACASGKSTDTDKQNKEVITKSLESNRSDAKLAGQIVEYDENGNAIKTLIVERKTAGMTDADVEMKKKTDETIARSLEAQDKAKITNDTYTSKTQKLSADREALQNKKAEKIGSGNVFSDGSGALTRQDKKDQKAAIKDEIKKDKIQVREAEKANNAAQNAASAAAAKHGAVQGNLTMQDEGDAKRKGCAAYGGADCDQTNTVNGMVGMAEQGSNIGGAALVNRAGSNAANSIAVKGGQATQNDINQGTLDTAKAAYSAEKRGVMINGVGALLQTQRLMAHSKSIKTINNNANTQNTNMDRAAVDRTVFYDGSAAADQSAIIADGNTQALDINSARGSVSAKNIQIYRKNYQTELANQRAIHVCADASQIVQCEAANRGRADSIARQSVVADAKSNIDDNSTSAVAAQKTAVNGQMTAMMGTLGNIRNHVAGMMAAKTAQKLAALTPTNNGFNYNPGAGNPNDPDGNSNTPPDNGGTVDNTTGDGPGLDPGNQQINPGLQDPGIGGAGGEGKFVAAPPPGGGAGGAGSLGSSGGTSAAKDDGAAKEGGPSKQQAGGGYASDGPAGGSGYRGSGSGAVGVDTSFADMLKKFLPGGEEDKKKDEKAMAFDDRSPASDQAAVIGRNKNIFEEIHKRYQKKSGEGAIVF